MQNLTDDELRAVAYYTIGVGSEGSDIAYQLGFCGNPVPNNEYGSEMLKPIGNSGYTIGEMQTDFGANKDIASNLVSSFQKWAAANHPDWMLKEQDASRLAFLLGRDGHHIRDPQYDAHNKKYMSEHHGSQIQSSLLPAAGVDIDKNLKSHLNTYLSTNDGKSFIHKQDIRQVDILINDVGKRLKTTDLYKNATPENQVKIFSSLAKAYNQNPAFVVGSKHSSGILGDIENNKIRSFSEINNKIDSSPEYMRTGRDAALSGAETLNAIRRVSEANPLHAPWQAVMANPLVDPTQLHADPKHPHLAEQYATVKALFVDPVQGRAFVQALEHGSSHNYGDPAKSNSRGFYAEGKDFVQWDRDGHGRAFVGGQWSEVSRSELALAQNQDGTLDVNLNRNGQTHSLLHVTHPSLHHHSPASAHAHHGHDAGTLHQNVHAHATTLDQHMPGMPSAAHSQSATRHDNPVVGGPTTGHVPLTPPTAKPPHLPLTTTQPLEPGDRGAAVQALQQHLQTIGATDRDGNAIQDDRHYGPRTQQAVENFQLWAGREATGIADPGTLEALQTHAQFATRQKAQDLAPGRHLADHAQPASSHLTDALTERPAPPRPDLATAQQQAAPKALEPYSSPNSPLHALYAHTKTTLEGKDVPMSEERLHQVVGKMALYDMSPGGNNQFAVKGDTLYVIDLDACYNRFSLDLREPAPSMQATLQHVQTQQQTLEAELSSMREPPSYSR
ncbi:peptidoglycan-binding domain-containing protein [Xanthomonas fragariae]|uniref:peptidoglycan-binding domain-containing protein n=1 Tax=Xanthomonas fragariae TaxID=48664 RepID=UPI0022AA51CC|nr:peptidoglycan-binding protein [Xanthomonas fragariae]WAT15215.1 peptidoglycan-binding domain-containing protein [Xanthomonas fragariae]